MGLWDCGGIERYCWFRESYTPSHTFISHREIWITAGFAGTDDLVVQSPLVIGRLGGKAKNIYVVIQSETTGYGYVSS